MFPETCWFDPLRPESCPSDLAILEKCIEPTSTGDLCDANDTYPHPTSDINNCGASDVYTTNCGGANLVYNPQVT